MAYAFSGHNRRRVLVPAVQFLSHNPSSGHHLIPAYPPPSPFPVGVLVGRRPVVGMDMEEIRTRALLQFMRDEGLVPSPEEEQKRRDVILQLKKMVLSWIKMVAWQRRLPKNLISSASATIGTYGSYGLGVYGPDSDIDALCLGPSYATLEDDFFIVLRNILESRPEVSEVHCVKGAKVPLMRFKFNGISIDMPYAQLKVTSVPDVGVLDSFAPVEVLDGISMRSLSGVRANRHILELVPNVKNFQSMLRCLKFWAKRRGIYSHLHGFFGGIHLAILTAYVCQRFPDAGISALLSAFFALFHGWSWPEPVILQGGLTYLRCPDGRSFMPIMMPCSPYEWCNSNITISTFSKIREEFQRGYNMTIGHRVDFGWQSLFEPFPYIKRYTHFLQIFLTGPTADELQDWLGWVKSRFRRLILKVEDVWGYCDPNPTEYVDADVTEPNSIFYWGLQPSGIINLAQLDAVKDDFMRSVDKEVYGAYEGSCCKLELSIVESSQLPKCMQLNSGPGRVSKACWRISNYTQQRRPVYSSHSPHYIVGYVATSIDYPNAVD